MYELVGQRWTDRGTALCTGVYDEELDQAAIVARSETSDAELLRSEIRMNDVYQRQQGTFLTPSTYSNGSGLIVPPLPSRNTDCLDGTRWHRLRLELPRH